MNRPIELTQDECRELLGAGQVGRVAVATPNGPRIVPVNYAVDGDALVFRTAPYSELGTYGLNADIAFEVDQLDYEEHQGWSVVAVGRATPVDDPADVAEIRSSWDPNPWVGGRRNLYLRLVWRDLTGRRIVHAEH
jgi:nitroimidazol reductase NimA-like FMN-containing flavoprotein (pyridoxamine 5'-phosphate oxidase superfamily)